MKKTILLALLSLFAINLASAQTKQPTMVESTRDINLLWLSLRGIFCILRLLLRMVEVIMNIFNILLLI